MIDGALTITGIPINPELRPLSQIGMHIRQRSHLPRHTRPTQASRRRHCQSGRNALLRRLPWRSQRDILRRRESPNRPRYRPRHRNSERVPRRSDRARQAGHGVQRPRHRDREARQVQRLQRHQDLLRPRRQLALPLRAQRAPLCEKQGGGDREAGHDLYDRADDQSG